MIRYLLSILISMFFLISCSTLTQSPIVVPSTGGEFIGTSTCIECHDDFETDDYNVHMRLKPFESAIDIGCESCHGYGSAHMATPEIYRTNEKNHNTILCFGKDGLSGEDASSVCLVCHRGGNHAQWLGSEHQQNGVHCLDCHLIHNNKNNNLLIDNNENVLCAKCHQDIKAKGFLMSHHPYPEGKMVCSDCHTVHGNDNLVDGLIKTDESLNDLCLSCHTRYQGPFVFEHEPVIDDCCSCHDAHGTVADNLLIQQEPFLCLQCHEAHFHTMRGNTPPRSQLPPGIIDPNTGQTVGQDQLQGNHSWQGAFLTKCTTCHQYVHGSDYPSQTGMGHGSALTR